MQTYVLDTIISFLAEARSSTAKTDKAIALKNLRSEYDQMNAERKAEFSEYFQLALEPTISFGITWHQTLFVSKGQGCDILPVMRGLSSRELTGLSATTAVELTCARSSKEATELLKLAIDKSLDCGISAKSFAKFFPEIFAPKVHMMKCEPASAHSLKKLEFPAIIQLKADGIRFNAVVDDSGVWFITYNGNKFDIDCPALKANLQKMHHSDNKTTYLDGELLFVDEQDHPLPRRTSNGMALKLIKGSLPKKELENIRLILWDIVTEDMMNGVEKGQSNIARFNKLLDLIQDNPDRRVEVIESTIVDNLTEVSEKTEEYIKIGLEGSIVKNMNAFWEPKRSKQCIKFKAERECELRVVGIVPGTRKYEGKIGSLQCRSLCDRLHVDVSGLTDEERGRTDWVGKVVTVRFNEVISREDSDLKSLFLPRIVEVRFDKDVPDDLETIMKS